MSLLLIFLILAFGLVLGIIEIPKMLTKKLYKDLWVFLILHISGIVLAILKVFKVDIPNPSDWITWAYSPVIDLLGDYFK